ncbi:NUDIX hydrolase [Geothrix sp.]|jgi:8-oxo-dGTP pyrophosphatase MutT (NUDIX family)|uniref:NUDIX domain-containing protein n=1 Tax=Geothrix sp. TaxID=1962974 RepID=UPI0025C156F1|nr:NUDIX hydrolase [Geothrix sp.]
MDLKPLPRPEHPDPYTVLERRFVYDSPWIRVREDRFRHRKGAEGRYAVCGFRRTACGVLALDETDRVVLVGQWRYPLEAYSWEIPEGGGDTAESPFEAIRRELAEEAGLAAQVWEPLCFFHTSNSSTEEEAFLFLATGLTPTAGHHAEDDEELMLHREPFADCVRRVLSGEITDSLTVLALLALQAKRSGLGADLDATLAERFFQRPQDHPSAGRARWDQLGAP